MPCAQGIVWLLVRLWTGVVYYMDTVSAGNSILVNEAITVYKEEFERKKAAMNKRVREIFYQADKMQRAYEGNIMALKTSLDRIRNDKEHLDDVLRDRETQLKVLTDPNGLK